MKTEVTISVEPLTKALATILDDNDILFDKMTCSVDDGYLVVTISCNGDENFAALACVHKQIYITEGRGYDGGMAEFKFWLVGLLDLRAITK